MKKLLWIGDAACPSGFARATHGILDVLDYRLGGEFNVTALGMNYNGDPHNHPYPIYAASGGGDVFGVGRMVWMCDRVKPDVIVVQQDGWNIPFYVDQLRRFKEHAGIPLVAAVAVDGKNFNVAWLRGVKLAIFWTEFGLSEARAGHYFSPATVIPLGVDLENYYPMDKREARRLLKLESLEDVFIVGNVNRNQPRKRLDLTVKYFAEWLFNNIPVGKFRHPATRVWNDAWLFLHCAPTGEEAVRLHQLAQYYGVLDRLVVVEPEIFYGVSEEAMRWTYNAFDVQVTTTQGEGMGLTTFEGMACGVPQIVPDWSALGELTKNAAVQVPCTSTAITTGTNVIGGVPDEKAFVEELDALYQDGARRELCRDRGMALVSEDRFRWTTVGRKFGEAIASAVKPSVEQAEEAVAK